jgi:hypothetical protein
MLLSQAGDTVSAMPWGSRVCALGAAAFFLLVLGGPANAMAKLKPITGKLSAPGYTVIALSSDGEAKTDRAPNGKFSLRPPAPGVTLHLRAADGGYAGPIVLASRKHGRRAVIGVKAGARLGRIKVKSGRGYAKLAHRPAKKWVDEKRWARARKGVAIGAGDIGLVRSLRAHGPAVDPDLDGIPNSLDIDDDGDLILDGYDRTTGARSLRAISSRIGGTFPEGGHLSVNTSLGGPGATVNVNGGSSDGQIAAARQAAGGLNIIWIGLDPGSGELDCGTLPYCSAGGTGRFRSGTELLADAAPFPACCDPDGDGFGSLSRSATPAGLADPFGPDAGAMYLYGGTDADQIHAGDVLIARGTVHGVPVESPHSVGTVFSTFPALASYSDGQGNSSSFSYPQTEGPAGPVPVRAGSTGDVVVTLTFWRPQRERVEGEPGQGRWMDIGNLVYAATVTPASAPGVSPLFCPESSYSAVDPNLTSLSPSETARVMPFLGGVRFGDSLGDRPSNPANTFTYTLNLSNCLASNGLSWPSSEPRAVNASIFAMAANDGQSDLQMALAGATFLLQP